jgi:predicted phosphodiesterase
MRLAVLSDIHGNPIALDAVLADVAAQGGVDAYWVLGDLVAFGPDPAGVMARLAALPNARFVRGNTDRYLVRNEDPPGMRERAAQEPPFLDILLEFARSIAWTRGYLTAGGYLDRLAELPLEQRLTLPGGTRMLGVHAAPGTDDGPGIHPGLSDAELAAVLAPADAGLVFVGHTHVPVDRTVGGVRVMNLGSVSNPATADLRACYVLLDADESGYQVRFRRVAYDQEAAIAAVERAGHPGARHILRYLRGENRSRWADQAAG